MTTYYFIADAPGQAYGYIHEVEGVATYDIIRDLERGLNCRVCAWTFTRELTRDRLVYGFTAAEAAEIKKELEDAQ